ncbi:hypothetical protein BKA67DRAFT_557303 [Truncatella angustata]|uniref:DUF7702 domain-containing protein n=1 Tax=Truncatella angustata TaxID=152316 RepID=A0A9P8UTN0_9PEZI|nr:uncharacterized protein BKA67DRAFT_557303 [Truncatella angustata]KAH6658154.1 hypothetical protein BKA67DRAFT_557303 [Truncatella angustata]KAH8198264.1 hypothetical protein TruAng_007562 [Truncatella angustata]
MLPPLAALGIAETVFYAPIAPLAVYLVHRNWPTRPRVAWYPFILLSLMRLAGGPVIIALAYDLTSEGLLIAATILLNVGVIPLLIVNFGFVLIVMTDNLSDKNRILSFAKLVRIALLFAIIVLVTGSSMATSQPNIARILQLTGYSAFGAILLGLLSTQLVFWSHRHEYHASSRTVLGGALVAAPFLIARNVYALLYYGTNYYSSVGNGLLEYHTSIWNPIVGSTVLFALMALLTEYIAICIYFYVGFSLPPDRGVAVNSTERDKITRSGRRTRRYRTRRPRKIFT